MSIHILECYPSAKPGVKVKATSMSSLLLEEEIKNLFKKKDDNYLYDAIELARSWFCDNIMGLRDTVTKDKRSETICKFFKEGKCRFGENCFNKHPNDKGCIDAVGLTSKSKAIPGKNEVTYKDEISDKSSSTDEISVRNSKKKSMKTASDVISRIQWDDDLPTEDFTVGYLDRFVGIVEKSFNSFSWEDIASVDYSTLAIPKHRIQYFKYKDTVVWDKRSRLDKVFGSTGDSKEVYDIIQNYKRQPNVKAEKYNETETGMEKTSNSTEDGQYSSSSEDECDDDITNQVEKNQKKWSQKDRPNFFFCFKVTNSLIKKKILGVSLI